MPSIGGYHPYGLASILTGLEGLESHRACSCTLVPFKVLVHVHPLSQLKAVLEYLMGRNLEFFNGWMLVAILALPSSTKANPQLQFTSENLDHNRL
ncbi:hypothetical protein TNCV_1561111 [Trichonephila clavipes]|nr:hypothetical protein TNCV_1561111 [Trichonephila clavipes]